MDGEYKMVKSLLAHEEDEAGGLMTTQFISLPVTRLSSMLAAVGQNADKVDIIYYMYVVDSVPRLLGVVNLRASFSRDLCVSE
jgi:magnesium transporter